MGPKIESKFTPYIKRNSFRGCVLLEPPNEWKWFHLISILGEKLNDFHLPRTHPADEGSENVSAVSGWVIPDGAKVWNLLSLRWRSSQIES